MCVFRLNLTVCSTVPDEELLLDSGIRVGECAALWLEDGSDTLVWHDDVEACKEVVVHQCNDALRGGEVSSEASIERGHIVVDAVVERDERVGCSDPSGCRGETGGGQD